MSELKNNIIQIPNFVNNNNLFNSLMCNIKWQYSNYFKRYYKHIDYNILSNNNELLTIINNIENNFNKKVYSIFLNKYENGLHYAPYHSDKYECDICLLSLGTTRILRYKHNLTKDNTDYILKDKDLLYIPNKVNNYYKHSLLKRTKINEPRISILFFLK